MKAKPAPPPAEGLAQLERRYAQIAELTRPVCMGECPQPGACCQPRYCDMALARARQFGIALPAQPHPTLRYMGPQGCVVPPYLRPLCAVHVCEPHLLHGGPFAEAYFELREEVCELEEKFGPGWPQGLARDYWE